MLTYAQEEARVSLVEHQLEPRVRQIGIEREQDATRRQHANDGREEPHAS